MAASPLTPSVSHVDCLICPSGLFSWQIFSWQFFPRRTYHSASPGAAFCLLLLTVLNSCFASLPASLRLSFSFSVAIGFTLALCILIKLCIVSFLLCLVCCSSWLLQKKLKSHWYKNRDDSSRTKLCHVPLSITCISQFLLFLMLEAAVKYSYKCRRLELSILWIFPVL